MRHCVADEARGPKPKGSASGARRILAGGARVLRSTEELRRRFDAIRTHMLDELVSKLANKPVTTTPEAIFRRKKRLVDGQKEAARKSREESLSKSKARPLPPKRKQSSGFESAQSQGGDGSSSIRIVPRGLGEAFVSWEVPPSKVGLRIRITESERTVTQALAQESTGQIFVSVPNRSGPYVAVIEDASGILASSRPQTFPHHPFPASVSMPPGTTSPAPRPTTADGATEKSEPEPRPQPRSTSRASEAWMGKAQTATEDRIRRYLSDNPTRVAPPSEILGPELEGTPRWVSAPISRYPKEWRKSRFDEFRPGAEPPAAPPSVQQLLRLDRLLVDSPSTDGLSIRQLLFRKPAT